MSEIAVGNWQKEKWEQMLKPKGCVSPLKDVSKQWSTKYKSSLNNLITRAKENGYTVTDTIQQMGRSRCRVIKATKVKQ